LYTVRPHRSLSQERGAVWGLWCTYAVARPHPPEAERTAEQIVLLIFYILN